MNNFNYYAPTKMYFGKGMELKLGEILNSYGIKKVLFHYGKGSIKKSGLYDVVIKQLNDAKIDFIELGGVEPNPKLSLVLKGVEIAKRENVELILAVGGGSVIDSSKAIAAGALVDFSPWKFNAKEEICKKSLPVASILTISAAGSDMSDSCVITNDETLEKRGFSSEHNGCLFSILNPELTYTVSPYQTACGIVDIMMHTLERYFSEGEHTDLTDNIALGLLKATVDNGRIVMKDPTNYDARANLMWANSLSHNGLTACGRSFVMAVHQLEHELSGMFDNISHGAGLAVLWPAWAKFSYKAQPERFLRFAYDVMRIEKTDNPTLDLLKGIDELQAFYKSIGMPTTLRELNVPEDSIEALAENAMFKGKRTLKDIVEVDYNNAVTIYKMAY